VKRVVALVLVLALPACTLADVADVWFYGPVPTETYSFPAMNQLTITTPEGERLTGAVLYGAERPEVLIFYCHGRGANLDYYWSNLQELARTGYTVAAVDYRGFGRSTGTPTEEGVRADVRTFLDALGWDPGETVYYGLSLGGAVCIDLAATHPPAVLVTEATFTSVDAMVADGAYADLPADFVLRSEWDSLGKIAKIATPYLALHGLEDDFVDPRYAEALVAAHPGEERLILVPGAQHEGVPSHLPGYADVVREFIEPHLR
jgi:pimeloyl-ACP methyl ester carboxylesterase